MATYNKTLTLLASKLGLSEEIKVISKAAEFERLLQAKSTAGSNLSDTSKFVICLDLASSMYGSEIDKKTAIKYSGLKSTQYTNYRKTVDNLLELNNDILTTNYLCLSLQCTSVQELADKILKEYQKQAIMEVDLNLPQYACMAVHQACRLNKVKVPKAKLIEKSRLKSAQWSKLDAEWTKFVDEKFAMVKKRGRPSKKTVVVEETAESMDIDINKIEDSEPQIEPYEDWKKRMLKMAYNELKDQSKTDKVKMNKEHKAKESKENKIRVVTSEEKKTVLFEENIELDAKDDRSYTPRRSPRKTPQKFSPYKSPSKIKGVRLLFPLN